MQKMMSGWGTNNRKTRPLKNTLANRVASVLTANQIRTILNSGVVLSRDVMRAIEHRAKNLPSLQSYMTLYYRNKRRRNM